MGIHIDNDYTERLAVSNDDESRISYSIVPHVAPHQAVLVH